MIRENLIFKFAFILSIAVHTAGFGLFIGNGSAFVKNGPIPDDDRVIVFEIGYKEVPTINNVAHDNQDTGREIEKQPEKAETALPVQGSGGLSDEESGRNKDEYLLKVREHIDCFKFYPKEARTRFMRGSVRLSFYIDENGTACDIIIFESSSFSVLDNAARGIILKANPFPKPPKEDFGYIKTTIVFD